MKAPPPSTRVNQKGASAGRDVVARDKVVYNYTAAAKNASVIEQLLQKLQAEMEENVEVQETIESLRYFYNKTSVDGIDGLEAKLKAGGRKHETFQALQKKELFAKALERWSLYASAQEIFVHLLAKAEHEFSLHVFPQIGKIKEHQVNQLVTERIVEPIVAECGATVFQMHHGMAMGMLYWLAEQCFVRWHQ